MTQIRPLNRSIMAMLLTLMVVQQAALAQNASDLVQARLLSDAATIQAGKPFMVAVQFKIAPQWHIYWTNPGDAGIPTTVKFELPEGFAISSLEYPTPTRFDQPGAIVSFGYHDEVMLLATITPPERYSGASIAIAATVKYLVCNDSCFPGEAKLSLSLPVGASKPSGDSEAIAKWKNQVPGPVGQSKAIASQTMTFVKSATRPTEGKISLKIIWADAPPAKLDWFPPASEGYIFTAIKVQTEGKTTTVSADVQRLVGQKVDSLAMDSVLAQDTPQGRRGIAIPIKFPADAGW